MMCSGARGVVVLKNGADSDSTLVECLLGLAVQFLSVLLFCEGSTQLNTCLNQNTPIADSRTLLMPVPCCFRPNRAKIIC